MMQDRTHTLKSFASSADWIKSLHFSEPAPAAQKAAAADRSAKRRKLGNYTGPEPTVEQIEAEFWRIVEMPDDVCIVLQLQAALFLLVSCQGLYTCPAVSSCINLHSAWYRSSLPVTDQSTRWRHT